MIGQDQNSKDKVLQTMASMSSAQIVSVSAMQNPRAPAAHPPPGAVAEYGSQVTPRPLAPPTRRLQPSRGWLLSSQCVCVPQCVFAVLIWRCSSFQLRLAFFFFSVRYTVSS